LLLVGSHAAPPPFRTVFLHLYALLIVSLVLGLSSRLICSQDICSQSTVHTSDIPLPGLSRVINSFLIYVSETTCDVSSVTINLTQLRTYDTTSRNIIEMCNTRFFRPVCLPMHG